MNTLAGAFRVYVFALALGLRRIVQGHLIEGMKLLLAPIGYWRFLPYGYAFAEFERLRQPAILDVGSPKLLSILLAAKTAAPFYATDLEDEKIFSRWKTAADSLRLSNYHAEFQDARHLTYPDQSFDFIYSISVIEHIPGDGDTEALREFWRVLKPNGRILIEVPYRRDYEDVVLNYDSMGKPLEQPRFYERHYDSAALDQRLRIDGLAIEKKLILGEWLALDPWIATNGRLPHPLRIAILAFEPWLAAVNYWSHPDDREGRPLAALLIYRKV